LGGNVSCNGCGTVFKLTPKSDGSWMERVLYSFTGGVDGKYPEAGLIFDTAGNLYGTTIQGGANDGGTIFKLTPNSNGSGTESVLYSFTGGADGFEPNADLIFDLAGNLYGTTPWGGAQGGFGTAFKLKQNSDGSWTETVLYSFSGGVDGAIPVAALIFDVAGNLYGTTRLGGAANGFGAVFELTPNSDGSWTESVLHSFNHHDGAFPYAGLIFDDVGNLYGTTSEGGNLSCRRGHGCGTVFKLTPNSKGSWAYSRPHAFLGKSASTPYSGLVLHNDGYLYGMTNDCGSGTGCHGVVFKLTP